MKTFIKLSLNSNRGEIEKASEKTAEFLNSQGLPGKIVHEQIIILKELHKICQRYSIRKSQQRNMTVQILIQGDKITVEVSYPINGIQNKQLEELDKIIQFIRGHQDSFEAYLKLKENSFKCSNGLALAKLAYEGKTILDFFVSEQNMINMVAVRTLNCLARKRDFNPSKVL
jgi:hypothetical protein